MLITSSVFPETCPFLNNIPSSPLPPIKLHNKRTGSLKFAQNPHFPSLRLPALSRDVLGGDGDGVGQGPLTNGSAFFSDEILSLPQVIMFFLSFAHKGECFISYFVLID